MKDCGIIESFEDFYNMYKGHHSSHYIYRGEASSKYKLRPKFGRFEVSGNGSGLIMEMTILKHFKRRGAPHITKLPENDWDWLALAQHFGLATKLLDWSENPLVAMYFATQNMIDDKDRVLYALDTKNLMHHEVDSSPFELSEVCTCYPRHIDSRITAQQGLFTCHPDPSKEFDHPDLERWVIKSESVIDLAIEIDGLGFNDSTMFPGLEGIAGHINDWNLRSVIDD